jgi:hypothetical protein
VPTPKHFQEEPVLEEVIRFLELAGEPAETHPLHVQAAKRL